MHIYCSNAAIFLYFEYNFFYALLIKILHKKFLVSKRTLADLKYFFRVKIIKFQK